MCRVLALLLTCLVAPSASANLLSRATVEGERIGTPATDAERLQPLTISGLYIYSFLLDSVDRDSRLGRGLARFPDVLSQQIQSRGVAVGSFDGNAALDRMGGALSRSVADTAERSVLSYDEMSDAAVEAVVAGNVDSEQRAAVSHRLVFLPESITRFSGWEYRGRQERDAGGGAKWVTTPGYAPAPKNIRSTVRWVLQADEGEVVAAGTMAYLADIRGFPDRAMSERMIETLQHLGIEFQAP